MIPRRLCISRTAGTQVVQQLLCSIHGEASGSRPGVRSQLPRDVITRTRSPAHSLTCRSRDKSADKPNQLEARDRVTTKLRGDADETDSRQTWQGNELEVPRFDGGPKDRAEIPVVQRSPLNSFHALPLYTDEHASSLISSAASQTSLLP